MQVDDFLSIQKEEPRSELWKVWIIDNIKIKFRKGSLKSDWRSWKNNLGIRRIDGEVGRLVMNKIEIEVIQLTTVQLITDIEKNPVRA
ncbi:hypothetical protein AV929_11810 [Haloarcula sp. K1]|nr:hypothetical protein AV929_11810 [Haloarcula sp. K1]